MADQHDIETKFWKTLKADRTIMLSVPSDATALPRPMTALIDGDGPGPIWVFTARQNELVKDLHPGAESVFTLASKGHDLFASVDGILSLDNDPVVIDRLWNPFVAAWYKGGKSDPDLVLLRFDAQHAEIWLDGSSLLAGIKMLFGSDPKRDYSDKVAKVTL